MRGKIKVNTEWRKPGRHSQQERAPLNPLKAVAIVIRLVLRAPGTFQAQGAVVDNHHSSADRVQLEMTCPSLPPVCRNLLVFGNEWEESGTLTARDQLEELVRSQCQLGMSPAVKGGFFTIEPPRTSYSDIWLNIMLGVSVSVFLDEINI